MTFATVEPQSFSYFDYKRYSFSLATRKGAYVFTSGHSASEFDPTIKKMICKGDLANQTRTAHEKLKLILEAASVSFDDVVNIVDYLTPSAVGNEQVVDEIRGEFFKDSLPAQSRLYVNQLVRPDALIEISLTALAGTSKKSQVNVSGGGPYPSAVMKGNSVYVSGLTCFNGPAKKPAVGGNIEEQAGQLYANLEIILAKLGAKLSDVMLVKEQLKQQESDDFSSLAMIRRQTFPENFPAVTQIVVGRLSHPKALMELECVAISGASDKIVINPGWRDYSDGARSPAVLKDGLIFMSGALPINHEERELVGKGDVVIQTRQAFSNIKEVLNAAGGSIGDVVRTEDYIVPAALANYRATADVRKELFKAKSPASSGVVVHDLTHPDALVQVDCTAMAD